MNISKEFEQYILKNRQSDYNKKKICIITAIYGGYEKTCKSICPQSVDYHKICFSDTDIKDNNGWEIDTEPYHLKYISSIDTGNYVNSLKNNKHTFNIAKYYKQNFYNIPKLKDYDIVIWMDGTIQIINPYFVEYLALILQSNPIVTFEHEWRNGNLFNEVNASNNYRYTSTNYNNQKQPYQDIFAQYDNYKNNGYNDQYWKQLSKSPNYGVWITCVVGFDLHSPVIKDFLNTWYLQTLKFTTQDQIGFPYALQKCNIHPYSFPDKFITINTNHFFNELYIKQDHGK